MKKRGTYFSFNFARILVVGALFFASAANALATVSKTTQTIFLGETAIKINVYEKNGGSRITFIAPHHNEKIGREIAKELIEKNGGRLVEIESLDESGNPARQLKFSFQGSSYSVDPNRIFTENGRRCGDLAEINETVKTFADGLLKMILAPNASSLRYGEKFLVAVHNNGDVDNAKTDAARARDLTAQAFIKYGVNPLEAFGAFHDQADGVYISNTEPDADNFILLSTPAFINFFAAKGFNVVVQKSGAKLQTQDCAVDDGSLSIYAGQRNIQYINLEADAATGSMRQRQMIEAVYELLQKKM
jgi:hypothetical protein